jgi:hypothetical protein
MTAPEQDPRVDDLRQRLRALGYLDAGVDRFVLASAREARAPWLIALFASLRIGFLAAILLGPATAIGLSARLPSLVTGSRDAVIVAIYFGVLFGLVVAVTAFVLSVLVSLTARRTGLSFTRRAPLLSRVAGVLVTLGCLAYLTLWWQTVIAGVGWSAPVWTASALALAAAISLLLGHAVTVGSSAVVMASAPVLVAWSGDTAEGQRSEVGGHGPRVGGQRSEVGGQGPGVGGQRSEVRGQGAAIGGQGSDVGHQRSGGGGQRGGSLTARAPSNVSRWAARIGIGVVAFGGAALLLTWSERTSRVAATAPTLTVIPSGLKVRVIAIDGLDTPLFEGVGADHVPPGLRAALSATRIRFVNARETNRGQDPARAWTTIATGQLPGTHGVEGLETRRLAGLEGSVAATETSTVARALRGATDLLRLSRPAIASGRERQSKTFWEVAASAGLKTSVVNWWATWPTTDQAGAVISDRAALRLDQGGALDAEIAPASLYTTLLQRWPELKARARTLATEALDATGSEVVRDVLIRSAELDALQLLLLSEVTSPTTDLAVVYLPGLDIVRYTLTYGPDTREASTTTRSNDAYVATLQYLIALDHLLASALAPRSDEVVMVITQPGRVTADTQELRFPDTGRLSARGASIGVERVMALGEHYDATDIAPTILYALGVPASRDLAGKPILDLFTPEFVARYPVRYVTTYGPPVAPSASRRGQPLDQETIDRLRSLGYVK